ncbi:hypothetical protein FRC09_017435 [Ceratobasidium sp. 395]|nr:hypothetical protein FRC09_017435 [Ceratobasidium sp. 395]
MFGTSAATTGTTPTDSIRAGLTKGLAEQAWFESWERTVKTTHVGRNMESVSGLIYIPSDPSLELASSELSKVMMDTIVGGVTVLLDFVVLGVFSFRRKSSTKATDH